jgi:UDP-N-acetylglucosamine 2-epimerase (non-hydrolysing)
MKKINILTIIGTRPEAIKLSPVIMELERRRDRFVSKVCITAQHREMLDQALHPFGITIHHDLNIMRPGQSLAGLTARALEGLDAVIKFERPDIVLVQGDTTTSFCGVLSAFYNRIRVGHVEAGLRTGDKYAPFPEEINRRLTSAIADFHFAPTEYSQKALMREGIDPSSIFITGNTVIDALLWIRDKVRLVSPEMPKGLEKSIINRQLILVTGHRRESFGKGLENICFAIRAVADKYKDIVFVYPVHLNPNVRGPVNRILGGHERIRLLDPLSYEKFIWLMDRALIVVTDSGGVQEEAPSLGKPVLVTRETTERPEGIEAGNAKLVGTQRDTIIRELTKLIINPNNRIKMSKAQNPYGDGHAAQKIVDILARS